MEDDFSDKFNCPICFEIPEKEIFQCRNGHTVCFGCGENISQCPQCRVKLESPKIRCRALEELLDMMRFDCANKSLGCTTKLKRYEIQNHIKNCTYAVQTIKLCEHLGFPCGFAVNTKSLQQAVTHLKTSHDFIICQTSNVIINLEGFESANSRKDSMWTPVLVDMTAQHNKLFILLSLINGVDHTLSFVCLDVSEASMKDVAIDEFKAHCTIHAVKSLEKPNIDWSFNPLQAKYFATEINESMHRFPLMSLRKHYVQDGVLAIKCSVERSSRSTETLNFEDSESVYALNICKNPTKGNLRNPLINTTSVREQPLPAPPVAAIRSTVNPFAATRSTVNPFAATRSTVNPFATVSAGSSANPFRMSHRTSRGFGRFKHRPPPPPPIGHTIFNSFMQSMNQATQPFFEIGSEIIFRGVSCDECAKRPITIIRFKCLQCHDYNLCKSCFDKEKHNHHTFAMLQNLDQNEALITRWNQALTTASSDCTVPDSSFTWNNSYLKCNKCSHEKKYVCLDCCSLVGYCNTCFRNVNHVENHCFAVTETVSKLGLVISLMIQSKFDPDETMRIFASRLL